jgi:hypothetical protein
MKKESKIKKLNKQDRILIVLDIAKKLRQFPKKTCFMNDPHPYVDLYCESYTAIHELKHIFASYVNQDDTKQDTLKSFSGTIMFDEIGRRIEYVLPIRKHNQPLFVLKAV